MKPAATPTIPMTIAPVIIASLQQREKEKGCPLRLKRIDQAGTSYETYQPSAEKEPVFPLRADGGAAARNAASPSRPSSKKIR